MGARAGDRLLDLGEVATWLNVTPKTIRDWRYRRTGPPALKVGGQLRWRAADVERWLDQQRDTATPAR